MLGLFQAKKKNLKAKNALIDFIVRSGSEILSANTSFNTLARRGYAENPIVYRCINRISEAAQIVDIKLFRYRGEKKEEIKTHPILKLLAKPNPLMSYADLIEALFTSKLIGGEAFMRVTLDASGNPLELWPIKPNMVDVSYDQAKDALVYKVTNGKTYYAYGAEDYECEILHWKSTNPLNDLRGLSPMIPAGRAILAFNSALEWNKCLVDNGAKPSGALVVKSQAEGGMGSLTDEQYERLKRVLDEEYSGAKNAGKPLLLEGGLDWKEMSLTPKDMDFNTSLLENARFICSTYGVPSQLVGVRGESTYSNYEQALISFWQDTVAPHCLKFALALNRWLLDFYNDKELWLELDYTKVDGLEPRKKEKADRVKGLVESGIIKLDEAREEIGYDNLEDEAGQVVLVNSSKVALEDLGTDLSTEMQGEYDQSVADMEAERPRPKPKESDPEEQPEDQED